MKRSIYLFIAILLAGGMLSVLGFNNSPKTSGIEPAAANITTTDLLAHVKKLSSDEFEGRSPATKGEELTINYLADNFKKLGLKPGNPDGTYFQKVPLISYQVDTNSEMTFTGKSGAAKLKFRDDYVAWTRQLVDTATMNGELVFVGYGAVAPEYKWDDFKDQDLKGKIVVILINDPPLPDDKLFGGRAMTYYGRWTYKFEIAAAKGAAGCLIVHETEPASYGWDVVKNSWGDGGFTIENPQKNRDLLPVEGWITIERAQELFKMAGKDFSEAKKAALSRDFKPIPLGVNASVSIKNSFKKIESNNVIAKIEGSDPKLKDEYVIFMAHWDHFGVGSPVNGDKIYNGARDNATGTAGLLELAKAYSKLPHATKRSLLFLAVTAEERGLLGSAYYGENPLYPHNKTVAAINMDSLNIWGRTKDITVIGLGNSSLDDYVKHVATKQSRIVKPDPQPEKGSFYRSDHFSFAKKGVPALDPGAGVDFVGKPTEWGISVRKNYNENAYHKPADEITADWDLSGAVEDLQLLFQVGFDVANAKDKPHWNEGTEFKAIREQSLKHEKH